MAYVTVPKDLTRVKSKIVFGLTKRQLICFGGALLVGVPLYFLLRGRVTGSAAALIMVFAMLPGFLLALYERHGQPLEVVVWQIVQCCFAVVHHIHGTENQVIVDVALVDVGCQHIGVFALQHFVGKQLADLMGLFRRGLAGGKGLDQVVGQIVAFLDGLRQQHFKLYVRCFIGAAKRGHQHFVLGLVRVLDVVQRLFQR